MRPTRPVLSFALDHLHLNPPTPYLRAAQLQDRIVRAHLDYKASPSTKIPPNPFLLTFHTPPTYTCGRREVGTLSTAQVDYLRDGGRAEFHEALRGGQITFHGPGQLTAYLICSLQAHGLTPRSYVRFLEECIMVSCDRLYGIRTYTLKEYPGVWVTERILDHKTDVKKKIASVGVHLRRNVSSHGVGLNLTTDLAWFGRITACGLPGNVVTNAHEQISVKEQNFHASPFDEENPPMEASAATDLYRAAKHLGHVVEEKLEGVRRRNEYLSDTDEETVACIESLQ